MQGFHDRLALFLVETQPFLRIQIQVFSLRIIFENLA